MTTIQKIQAQLEEVEPDGIWGPISQEALIEASDQVKMGIQILLGVTPDGIWGPISQHALNILIAGNSDSDDTWFSCHASTFADPADLISFKHCKATGKTDLACFAVGDNGIGQFGKITSQDEIPMIAVHKDAMIARWGTISGAAHRPVEVQANGVIFKATVEDRISEQGRIDLNPACAKIIGMNPPFVIPCKWRWI